MSAFNVAPGVYLKETNLSQRVKQLSTSIAAIVLASGRGPVMERTYITSQDDFLSIFGKPNPRISRGHYAALEFLKQGNRLYVTRVVNTRPEIAPVPLTAGAFYTVDDIAASKPRGSLTVFDDGTSNPQGKYDPLNTYIWNPNQPGIQNQMFFICAANPGTWNNDLYINIRPSYKAGLTEFDAAYDDPATFYVDVYVNYTSPRQNPDESFKVKLVKELDGFGNQLYIEDVINRKSKLVRVSVNPFGATATTTFYYPANCFFAGATNGGNVTRGQIEAGWDLYSDPEKVDVNLFIQGGAPIGVEALVDIAEIQRHMTDIANTRMDCVALLDIPSTEQEVSYAVTYRNETLNIDSSYASIFTPDMQIYDEYNDLDVWVPPSGFVAASCALTDRDFSVFYAPAGMSRGGIDAKKSAFIYNQGMRNALDDAQINAVRWFANGAGFKIWGSSTLAYEASDLSFLPTRRLLCYIEKSLSVTHLYSVFEPNNVVVRSRIVAISDMFLRPIKDAGGLYWYGITCDESNNPPDVIAAGDCNLYIGFDPVIMTKRINLEANILKTGANFREYLTAR
jgi:hypothetical protein